MKVRAILLTTVVYLSFCGQALGWGDTAHQVTCEIAFRLARPFTQAEVQRLILTDPPRLFGVLCLPRSPVSGSSDGSHPEP
jgi:hypothetical protein